MTWISMFFIALLLIAPHASYRISLVQNFQRQTKLQSMSTLKLPSRSDHDISFDIVYKSLKAYKNDYNSTNIPYGYNPGSFHGENLPLGTILHHIRLGGISLTSSEKSKLTELGYSINKFEYQFELFLLAWIRICQLKGTASPTVPRTFVVPHSTSDWPPETWGFDLGKKIQCIRAGQIFNSELQRQKLDAAGFVWSPAKAAADQLHRSLKAYFESNGHMEIPKGFVIPADATYDQDCWGMKLGLKVSNIRYRGSFAAFIDSFQRAGLETSKAGSDTRHWSHIYSALVVFKRLNGHVDIPAKFEVPEESDWPIELHGLKLGFRVKNIRYRGDFVNENEEYRQQLDQLGFRWKTRKNQNHDQNTNASARNFD